MAQISGVISIPALSNRFNSLDVGLILHDESLQFIPEGSPSIAFFTMNRRM
jgi:hypothetical protein